MQLINDLKIEDELIFDLSLARISFLSLEDKRNLKKNLDSARDLALLSIEEIETITGKNFKKDIVWNGFENLRIAKISAYYCRKFDIKVLLYSDEKYPELLRQINKPPYLLFCRGNIDCLGERSVSVVGTRKLSPDGKKAAYNFGYDAVLSGCNIVSGLANGADEYAHKGAVNALFDAKEKGMSLENLGKTIAVLPGSIDEVTPYSNKKLAESILKTGGCIISEYEPKVPLEKWHFIARNRIIAGLSPATIVIEAPCGSGALITADFALDFNRDLMFHEVAFGKLAKQVSISVEADLDKKFAGGIISKYKRENTAEKFLEAGAPIIKNYKDYCVCLAEKPGIRNSVTELYSEQKELFIQDSN